MSWERDYTLLNRFLSLAILSGEQALTRKPKGNMKSSDAEEKTHRHPVTREALHGGVLQVIHSARHELLICSPALDVALFNSTALSDALSRFLAGRAQNRARIVVEDTEHMLLSCTRLVELARRLSDLLQIRRLGEAHHGMTELFVVADRESCLRQPDLGRTNATLDMATPRLAAPLAQRFDEIWDASEPAPGLHGFRL